MFYLIKYSCSHEYPKIITTNPIMKIVMWIEDFDGVLNLCQVGINHIWHLMNLFYCNFLNVHMFHVRFMHATQGHINHQI
jgi:hypothetical protein